MRALALVLLTGCSQILGIDDVTTRGADDAGAGSDAATSDVLEIDAGPQCDSMMVIPENYRPVDQISTGAVTVNSQSGGVTTLTIDATAGGLSGAGMNPFVYVNLTTNARVAITDVQALNSPAWDIALKRTVIRTNSGDSGTGGRSVAAVQTGSLGGVTVAPGSGYIVDDWTTTYPDCALITDSNGLGEPVTALAASPGNVWYEYNGMVIPSPYVFVVHRPDGSNTAVRIISYYDTSSPPRGAVYQIEYKQLPPS